MRIVVYFCAQMARSFLNNALVVCCLALLLPSGHSHAYFNLSDSVIKNSVSLEVSDSAISFEIWEDFREYADLECTVPRRLSSNQIVVQAAIGVFRPILSNFIIRLAGTSSPIRNANLQPCYGFLFHYTPF